MYEVSPESIELYNIRLKLLPQPTVKIMFDVCQLFTKKQPCNMSFFKEGMRILQSNLSGTASCCFDIYGDKAMLYHYGMPKSVQTFTISVDVNQMHLDIKKENKSDPFYMNFNAPACSLFPFIIMMSKRFDDKEISQVSGQPCQNNTMQNYVDYYRSFYCFRKPSARESLESFTAMYTKTKTSKYNFVLISMDKNGLVTYTGVKEVDQLNINNRMNRDNMYSGVKLLDESYDYENIVECEPVSYVINMKDIAWLGKIKGFNKGSISIYMYPGTPLVLTTNIEDYGEAIFTIKSCNPTQSPVDGSNSQLLLQNTPYGGTSQAQNSVF